jgi:kumamolisin
LSKRQLSLALAILACLAGLALAVDPVGRLQAAGTASSPQVLPGHVLKALAASHDLGLLAADQPITLTIALKPGSVQALQDAARQASLAARSGRPPLAPADVGRLAGASAATIQSLSAYFAGFGLRASPPPADHLSFQVSGTVAQVQASLGVQLHRYQDAQGHAFFATDRDPQLPAALAPAVQAIFGLDNYPALQPLRGQASAPTPGDYRPSDMQIAYDFSPLYAQGWTGAGQTIGIIGCDAFRASDLQTFRQQFSLPSTTPAAVAVDGGANGSDVETTLDLEWSGAIATGASLRYYGFASNSGGCPFQGLLDALAQAANDNVASVLSISLGACEADYVTSVSPGGSTFLQAMENEFAVASAEQIGVFVASGDSGAFTCSNGQNTAAPTVSYPASSPNVVAVGGTSLQLTKTSAYKSESAWGDPTECSSPCGSGGGYSQFFPEPAWQVQAGIGDRSGGRGVPDVSYDADPATGNVVYFTLNSSLGCTGFCGGVGGTSIAAPQWAGLAAIANQAAGHRLGNLAAVLYSGPVGGSEAGDSPPFHDVTTGNNLFYNAAPGWDPATGLGSPDANALVRLFVFLADVATPTVTPTITLTPTPTPSPTATTRPGPGTPVPQIYLPGIWNAATAGW